MLFTLHSNYTYLVSCLFPYKAILCCNHLNQNDISNWLEPHNFCMVYLSEQTEAHDKIAQLKSDWWYHKLFKGFQFQRHEGAVINCLQNANFQFKNLIDVSNKYSRSIYLSEKSYGVIGTICKKSYRNVLSPYLIHIRTKFS